MFVFRKQFDNFETVKNGNGNFNHFITSTLSYCPVLTSRNTTFSIVLRLSTVSR